MSNVKPKIANLAHWLNESGNIRPVNNANDILTSKSKHAEARSLMAEMIKANRKQNHPDWVYRKFNAA